MPTGDNKNLPLKTVHVLVLINHHLKMSQMSEAVDIIEKHCTISAYKCDDFVHNSPNISCFNL